MTTGSHLLEKLADGTVKQRNPFTGTQVWTMPGRARRPLPASVEESVELPPGDGSLAGCAFCPGHGLDNPPEKARLVREGEAWRTLTGLAPDQLDRTTAWFRRVPNLFEICSQDYWRLNHGVEPSPAVRRRVHEYLADEAGREHLARVWRLREGMVGTHAQPTAQQLEAAATGWFSSRHELVIPRRHHVDGATSSDQLASAGSLDVDEHRAYWDMSVEAMAELYASSDAVRYVSVFQNWLRPAGASFEHLHRQVVAIDEVGGHVTAAAERLLVEPDAFTVEGLDVAVENGLLLAANDHAVAFAGFGHRYPAVEVYSLSPRREPWLLDRAERDGLSDLVHAIHAAGGAQLSCNEEWHHRPPGMDQAMPWRIVIKWRISTLAGFEGDTKIYLNALSPWDVRDRVLPRLVELRSAGRIASMRIGDEVQLPKGSLPR